MREVMLVLTNSSSGLFNFRRELLSKCLKNHAVYVSVPCEDEIDELHALGCTVIDTPVDRRGINPLTDVKLFRQYRRLLRQIQ